MLKRFNLILFLTFFIVCIFYSYSTGSRNLRSEGLNNKGVYVVKVIEGSPAAKAGVFPGDIILLINGLPVSSENIESLLLDAVNTGKNPVVLMILRQGKTLSLSANIPKENPTLGVTIKPPQEMLSVASGGSSGERLIDKANRKVDIPDKTSLLAKVSSFNVLDGVFIDKNTGEITFVGHYDDRYKTGPLPYIQILDEALTYPYPSFSLDPTENTYKALNEIKSIFDREMERIARDHAYGANWVSSILKEVLYASSPLPEKQILLTRLKAYSITPEEFKAYLDWDPKSKNWRFDNRAQIEQYVALQNFFYKLFVAAGFEGKYGAAVVQMWGFRRFAEVYGTDHAGHWFREIYETLGVIDEFEKIRSDYNSGKLNDREAIRQLLFLFYKNFLKGIGVKESTIDELIKRAPAEKVFDQELSEFTNRKLEEIQTEVILNIILNNLVLSDSFLKKRFKLPLIETKPTYVNLSSETYIAKTFFYADYTLKYLTTLNLETANLKDFYPFIAYLNKRVDEKGKGGEFQGMKSGFDRYWLFPGKVELKVSPDNSAFYFIKSEVKIGSEPLTSGMPSWYNDILREYVEILTGRYEEFAQIFPSLHTMREIQKVLALARWIKANNLKVVLPAYQKVDLEGLSGVSGATVATFSYSKIRDSFSFFVENHGGGVDYREKSNAWIQGNYIETKDALHQLAASSALAEKALNSALAGDLESARDFAEKSAQAMVGQIDLSALGAKIGPYVHPKLSNLPIGSQGVLNKKVLEVVSANLDAYTRLKREVYSAESIKNTEPEKYELILTKAKEEEAKVKASLQKLNELLSYYRQNPLDYLTLGQKIAELTPNQTLGIDPTVLKQKPKPATLDERAESQGRSEKESLLPDEKKLREELSDLRHKLYLAKTNLDKLTKGMLENTKEFESWREETEKAISRSEERFKEMMLDIFQDSLFKQLKKYFSKSSDRVKELERFKQLLNTKDYTDWASVEQHTWEDIAEGVVKAINAMPGISDTAQDLVKVTSHLINTGYDVTVVFIHWRKMKEFEKNLDLYYKAVSAQKEYIEKTMKRIKEIEEELQKLNQKSQGSLL